MLKRSLFGYLKFIFSWASSIFTCYVWQSSAIPTLICGNLNFERRVEETIKWSVVTLGGTASNWEPGLCHRWIRSVTLGWKRASPPSHPAKDGEAVRTTWGQAWHGGGIAIRATPANPSRDRAQPSRPGHWRLGGALQATSQSYGSNSYGYEHLIRHWPQQP